MSVTNSLLASVLAFATMAGGALAQVKEVEVVHWWTSGGEAAALNVLKQNLQKEGFGWKDNPIAGGSGVQAMTVLRARVTSGNIPTAVQMLGFDIQDWAEQGMLADLTPLATKENWESVIPTALQRFSKYQGKWIAAPVNVHSTNWIWVNKAVMDKIGAQAPSNWDELVAFLDKAKAAGVTPLAHGGQPWQDATLFEFRRADDGRPGVLSKNNDRSRSGGAFLEHDEDGVRTNGQAAHLRGSEFRRPRLEPRFRHGDQGRGGDADHGRLGEGRVRERRQEAQ